MYLERFSLQVNAQPVSLQYANNNTQCFFSPLFLPAACMPLSTGYRTTLTCSRKWTGGDKHHRTVFGNEDEMEQRCAREIQQRRVFCILLGAGTLDARTSGRNANCRAGFWRVPPRMSIEHIPSMLENLRPVATNSTAREAVAYTDPWYVLYRPHHVVPLTYFRPDYH